MKTLFGTLILVFAFQNVYADEAQYLSRQFNLELEALLVKKIEKLPVDSYVEVIHKHGPKTYGIYKKYDKFSETIFIRPENAPKGLGFLFDDAYDPSELQDVRVVSTLKR